MLSRRAGPGERVGNALVNRHDRLLAPHGFGANGVNRSPSDLRRGFQRCQAVRSRKLPVTQLAAAKASKKTVNRQGRSGGGAARARAMSGLLTPVKRQSDPARVSSVITAGGGHSTASSPGPRRIDLVGTER